MLRAGVPPSGGNAVTPPARPKRTEAEEANARPEYVARGTEKMRAHAYAIGLMDGWHARPPKRTGQFKPFGARYRAGHREGCRRRAKAETITGRAA